MGKFAKYYTKFVQSTGAKDETVSPTIVTSASLTSYLHNARHLEHFIYGCRTLFTINIYTKEKAFDFLRKSKLITITVNIRDSRTHAPHIVSRIYRNLIIS